MNIAETTVPLKDVMKGMTMVVHITGMRMAILRLRMSRWVMWLAAVVGGVGIRFERDSDEEAMNRLREYIATCSKENLDKLMRSISCEE